MQAMITSSRLTLIGRWLLATAALLPTAATRAQVAPRAANDFVNSVGICTHWGYPDTPYGARFPEVLQLLTNSGIRHVRDSDRPAELTAAGIGSTFYADVPDYADGNAATVRALLTDLKAELAAGHRIDAVEGPNEPDLFWQAQGKQKSYLGEGWQQGPAGIARGTIAFMRELHRVFKADPATRNIPIIGPSLGADYDSRSGSGRPNILAAGSLTDFVDYGNFHPYPGNGNAYAPVVPYAGLSEYFADGTQPSCNLDEWPAAFNTYRPPFGPRPMMATETGYSTSTKGAPESVHTKYIPRMFLEYFRLGVVRTYSYEFVDEFANQPDNNEAHFGLLRNDLSPKPAYAALRSLLRLLQEPEPVTPGFVPQPLAYTLRVAPPVGYDRTQYVRQVLLQKQDGTYYLVLYHEIANSNNATTPQAVLTHPAMPTTLTLPASIRQVTAYTYDAGYNFQAVPVQLSNNQLTVPVQDQVLVLALSTRAPLVAGPAGPPAPVLSLYPNPATDKLTMAGAAAGTPVLVLVRDLLGRVVLAASLGAGGTLDVRALAPGAYWLTLGTDGAAPRAARLLKVAR